MLQNESDDYSVSRIKNIIVSALYDNNVLCGYQKKIQFIDGFYHKKIYDKNKQILSDKTYSHLDVLVSGNIYHDNKLTEYIETAIDSYGIRHEIYLDATNKVIAHKKFDKYGRFIGGGVYENGILIGSKEIKYTENGVYETVLDVNYKVLLNKKIDITKYIDQEYKKLEEIVLEKHVMSRTSNGAIYKTVFDSKNHIISEPTLISEPKPSPINQIADSCIKNDTNTTLTTQNIKNNKIFDLLYKLFLKNK